VFMASSLTLTSLTSKAMEFISCTIRLFSTTLDGVLLNTFDMEPIVSLYVFIQSNS
jgi:hypothetical protein